MHKRSAPATEARRHGRATAPAAQGTGGVASGQVDTPVYDAWNADLDRTRACAFRHVQALVDRDVEKYGQGWRQLDMPQRVAYAYLYGERQRLQDTHKAAIDRDMASVRERITDLEAELKFLSSIPTALMDTSTPTTARDLHGFLNAPETASAHDLLALYRQRQVAARQSARLRRFQSDVVTKPDVVAEQFADREVCRLLLLATPLSVGPDATEEAILVALKQRLLRAYLVDGSPRAAVSCGGYYMSDHLDSPLNVQARKVGPY